MQTHKIILSQDRRGNHYWTIQSHNNRVIARSSQSYKNKTLMKDALLNLFNAAKAKNKIQGLKELARKPRKS